MSDVTREEGLANLKILAELLLTLPEQKFDYGSYVGKDWEGKPDLSCGTTACALGWATTIPAFRELGLRMVQCDGHGVVCLAGSGLEPSVRPYASVCEAAGRVFALDSEETEYLFINFSLDDESLNRLSEEATASDVAAHILEFVEAGGIPE